jgi:hypothetical protein
MPDGAHLEWTYVMLTMVRGHQVARLEMFDEGAVDAAVARFDELTPVDPRTPAIENECARVVYRHGRLLQGGELEASLELLAPEMIQLDRRKGVAAPDLVGREARLENLAAVAATFGRFDLQGAAVRGEHLSLHRWTITNDSDFAVSGFDLYELDDDGRIGSMTTWDADDLTVAIQAMEARHAELCGPDLTAAEPMAPSPALENDATRALAALSEAMPDWDRLTALYAEDVVTEDRRAGVSSGVSTGREATLDLVQGWLDVGFAALRYEVLAVRGEHLTLVSRRFELGDGFEVSLLAIAEIDAEGRFTLNVLFDEDDLRSAVEALEHRYLEWHGSAILDPERTYIEYTLGFNRGMDDLDHLAEGYRMIDHSPAGFGTSDASELRDNLSVMRRQVPSLLLLPAKVHGSAQAVLSRYSILGTGTDGTDFRWEMTGVECVDADGLVVRNHIFQIEQWDDAVAVFDEWSGAPMAPSPALENDVTRAMAQLRELFSARDWDAVAGLYPEGVGCDDRRTGVNSGVTTGRDGLVAIVRGLADVGFVDFDTETIAVRGDRLALMLRRWRRQDGFELPVLAVQEVDDQGRQSWIALFDPDDRAAAEQALEDRWAGMER